MPLIEVSIAMYLKAIAERDQLRADLDEARRLLDYATDEFGCSCEGERCKWHLIKDFLAGYKLAGGATP